MFHPPFSRRCGKAKAPAELQSQELPVFLPPFAAQRALDVAAARGAQHGG